MTIHYFFKYFLAIFFAVTIVSVKAQYIAVDTWTYGNYALVRDVFFGAGSINCIQVSNVQISGRDFGRDNKSWGYFNRNGSTFEMAEGIILSTGSALEAVGPNTYIQTQDNRSPFADASWQGDQDLINILNENGLNSDNILNATVLEFDFVSLKSNQVSFEYIFLSEEYRKQNCEYSDAFAFLIKKSNTSDEYKNIALVPGTNIPVSTLTINAATNCPKKIEYFGSYNEPEIPTNFNGQTKILTAKTDVELGTLYHIKLVIADHGDRTGLFDSAVFLKAGSFIGTKDLGPDLTISSQTALCEGSTTQLDASISTPGATYQWYNTQGIIAGATNSTYIVSDAGVYEVLIDDGGCKLKGSIKIEYAEKPIYNSNNSFCKFNDGQPIAVYLQEFNSQIIANYKPYFRVKYYRFEDDAIAGNDNTVDTLQYTDDTTIYVRAESSECDAPVKAITFKTAQKSLLLKDQVICPNSTTRLEVETSFTYYQWKTASGQIIQEGASINYIDNVSAGNYSLILTSQNGCSVEQKVTITEKELPQITNIDVSGSTATVSVIGGTAPYQYSLDNLTFQSSNIFTNVQRGLNTVYVKDAQNCYVIMKEFLVVNLINVLTPNSDGKNEVLDYSDLNIKKEVKIEIYDRYGNQVFLSQKQPYVWDGKMNGRILPTGSYWYILNWIEPDTNLPVSYKGWVLLNNRE